jgi:hypothetical protein
VKAASICCGRSHGCARSRVLRRQLAGRIDTRGGTCEMPSANSAYRLPGPHTVKVRIVGRSSVRMLGPFTRGLASENADQHPQRFVAVIARRTLPCYSSRPLVTSASRTDHTAATPSLS